MIEKLAETLAEKVWYGRVSEHDLVVAREAVRAVLEELRTPSEGMLDEGWLNSPSWWTGCEDDLFPVWQAMIDAALKEGGGE